MLEKRLAMAMTVELPALEQVDTMAPHAPSGRLRRLARPALGLLLPVGLALAWEIIVRLGLSSGRLVPPPTKLFATIVELARSGELARRNNTRRRMASRSRKYTFSAFRRLDPLQFPPTIVNFARFLGRAKYHLTHFKSGEWDRPVSNR